MGVAAVMTEIWAGSWAVGCAGGGLGGGASGGTGAGAGDVGFLGLGLGHVLGACVVVEGFGSLAECLGVLELLACSKGTAGRCGGAVGGWLLRRLKKI